MRADAVVAAPCGPAWCRVVPSAVRCRRGIRTRGRPPRVGPGRMSASYGPRPARAPLVRPGGSRSCACASVRRRRRCGPVDAAREQVRLVVAVAAGERAPGSPSAGQLVEAVPEFDAAGGGAFVVVVGPGEVEAEASASSWVVAEPSRPAQFGLAFGGVALFAEHDVEPVPEGVAAAGPGVVRGERGCVQGTDPLASPGRGAGTVRGGEVLQQRLHDVPRAALRAPPGRPACRRGRAARTPRTSPALVEARQQPFR